MLGCAVKHAAPVLPCELLHIFSPMTLSPGHVFLHAALLTGFGALLRKYQLTMSELILLRYDFSFDPRGKVIKVRRSKTIQFAQHKLIIPVARIENKALCAIHWVKLHFAQAKVGATEPAFQLLLGPEGPTL